MAAGRTTGSDQQCRLGAAFRLCRAPTACLSAATAPVYYSDTAHTALASIDLLYGIALEQALTPEIHGLDGPYITHFEPTSSTWPVGWHVGGYMLSYRAAFKILGCTRPGHVGPL